MPDSPDALSVACRAVSFVLLLNAAGIPIFIAAFGRLIPGSVQTVSRLGWKLAVGGLVFVAGHQALEAARMAGDLSGVMDPEMQRMALQSPAGAAFALRMVGLALVAGGLALAARRPRAAAATGTASSSNPLTLRSRAALAGAARAPRSDAASAANGAAASDSAPPLRTSSRAVTSAPSVGWASVSVADATSVPGAAQLIALFGSILAITAFTLTGHTSVNPHRAAGAALLILHLLVVAFWHGALWPLYLVAARESPAIAARMIDTFSVVAAWIVPAILLAGLGLTVLLVPGWSVFKQPYGIALLAKLTLFVLLMALASLNKWRFGPACAGGETKGFKRTVLVEFVVICLVLAITAGMTTFFSPEVA